jgi:hypothetical protein
MKLKSLTTVLLFLTLVLLGACSGQNQSDEELVALVENFHTARNEGDWEKAATYLAEDIIWDTPTGRVEGRDAWLTASTKDNGGGIVEDIQNLHVDGETVVVEMIVTGPDFQAPAVAKVLVEDGKIQRYTVTPP